MMPSTLITLAELAATRHAWAEEGARVAFVPTMGALHQGHLRLVRQAKAKADRVLVSIFVNPTQFAPGEDFAKYPRTVTADLQLLSSEQVDAVFLPSDATMYPDGFQTYVHNKVAGSDLDGGVRKNHFEGVLTVVSKLFNLAAPHLALFGKKDYQQWRLIERMVRDLNMPLAVVGVETEREADGLALSSRNRYLSDAERQLAPRLYQGLQAAKAAHAGGTRDPASLVGCCRTVIASSPAFTIDYVELRRQQDLTPFDQTVDAPSVMLLAARLGATRLIDNLEMD